MTTGTNAFPVLRWVGLLWTVVWLPTYIRVWGWANLLHLCDIAVILGCAGLWWARLLSSFHIALPVALLWAMRKIGYDRRALALQAAIAAGLFVVSRFLPAGFNMNYAYQDPLFHRSWGPAPAHLAVILVGAVAVVYWPTHLLLIWMFPAAGAAK